jgi:DNA-binding SARP family transcriptional activator
LGESDKARALLVYLAVEADRPHRRESLVGLLWPDCPEQVARHNLRQALFNLRQAIGDHAATPPYLLISRDAIQFNRASDFSLDLAQFNTIFMRAKRNRSRGIEDPRSVRHGWKKWSSSIAASSCRTFSWKIVPSLSSGRWYSARACTNVSWTPAADLATITSGTEIFQAARRHASRQLELDPWREEAHCQMMRALALDGQRSAALAQYETCRRVLAEELGVEPSPRRANWLSRFVQGSSGKRMNRPPPAQLPPSTTCPYR